jgi:hypothetical protein
MIRRVAFGKAVLAGAAGALAWELVVRALLLAGLPLFDLVRTLGTMFAEDAPWYVWWPIGLAMHLAVGAIWAIFYAYFFWSELPGRPVLQGLQFSLFPALLAGLIMVPQMGWMHEGLPYLGLFGSRIGWGGPATVLLGHCVFGLVLGAIYTRPVGYRVGRLPSGLART